MTGQPISKPGRGRPTVFKPEFTADVERLCKLGFTDADLARRFNVGHSTISLWKKQYPDFFAAMQRGKDRADEEAAAKMFDSVTGHEFCEEHAFKMKRETTKPDGTKIVEDYIEKVELRKFRVGETTAQIFWLKNRRPDQWRDVKKIEAEHKVDISVRGKEALEMLKEEGFVVIEGQYDVVGIKALSVGEPVEPDDTDETLLKTVIED